MDHEFGHLVAMDICAELRATCERVNVLYRDAITMKEAAHSDFQRKYHAFEIAPPFNGREGYCYAKAFQNTLRARRQAKWDVEAYERLAQVTNKFLTSLGQTAMELQRQQRQIDRYVKEGPTKGEVG